MADLPVWAERLPEPPQPNLQRIGCANFASFVDGGSKIAGSLAPVVREYSGVEAPRVLDFGCGIGRVAIPLHHELALPTDCCDVDESAIQYLSRCLPSVSCFVSDFFPPLPFGDSSFDIVYSVSIWTHLSIDMQLPWLEEVRRVLKPGGIALISTSSFKALAARRRRKMGYWVDVTDEQLVREGIIYKESKYLHEKKENYPGVTASYGMTAHHPDWIRENWSSAFDIVDIRESLVAGTQDLNILRKR